MPSPTTTTTPKAGNTAQNATANKSARDPLQLRMLTERLAYQIWEKKGRRHGHDRDDWVEAERVAKQQLGWS